MRRIMANLLQQNIFGPNVDKFVLGALLMTERLASLAKTSLIAAARACVRKLADGFCVDTSWANKKYSAIYELFYLPSKYVEDILSTK